MISIPAVSVKPLPGSDLVFAGVARYELGYADRLHTIVIERMPSGQYQWFQEPAGVQFHGHSDPGDALTAAMRLVAESGTILSQTVPLTADTEGTALAG